MIGDKENLNGFTYIELIIVIVIFTTITAFCVSKYLSITNETALQTTKSMAQVLNAANTANVFIRKMNPARGITISNCSDAQNLLYKSMPSGMVIDPRIVSADDSVQCTLLGPSGSDISVKFNVNGIN